MVPVELGGGTVGVWGGLACGTVRAAARVTAVGVVAVVPEMWRRSEA